MIRSGSGLPNVYSTGYVSKFSSVSLTRQILDGRGLLLRRADAGALGDADTASCIALVERAFCVAVWVFGLMVFVLAMPRDTLPIWVHFRCLMMERFVRAVAARRETTHPPRLRGGAALGHHWI